jgi:Flp pilus assembly pilin Flp
VRQACARRGRRPDESGASSIEYGLVVFAIAAVVMVAWFSFGAVVSSTFFRVSSCISAQANSVC